MTPDEAHDRKGGTKAKKAVEMDIVAYIFNDYITLPPSKTLERCEGFRSVHHNDKVPHGLVKESDLA